MYSEPFGPLAVLPIALFRLLIQPTNIIAFAVLFPVSPLADILTSITPNVFAVAVLAVMFVSALITTTIIPSVEAIAMH